MAVEAVTSDEKTMQVWGIEVYAPKHGYSRRIYPWPKDDLCGKWFDEIPSITAILKGKGWIVRPKPFMPDPDFDTGC